MASTDLPDLHLARPSSPNGTGVLVLSGSSGRVEVARADLLARQGVQALTYRWFGGPGQPPGICEQPLELFEPALDLLATECERIVLVGVSKSAEAFLLYAAHDPRVDGVVALAPSHVAWANVGAGADGQSRPQRSSWSWRGVPVPFVSYDDDLPVAGDPPEFRPVYEHSLRAYPAAVDAARIPVEQIFAEVVLAAGEDDRVWPAADSAREVEARRAAYGLPTTLVTHPSAGHRAVLPGEPAAGGGARMARGGSAQ
ncbi:acyl-CoA thioesterase, partial [Intrasporangium chromatireducens Q5-1]